MVYFERPTLLLFLTFTLPVSIHSSIIPDDEIIWKAGTPIPQAVEQLKQRVVEVLQRNPDLHNPPVDIFPQFFHDMHLIGRTSGERAHYPLTGFEWNTWYPRELERIRSDRNAYFRSVQETQAEAAWMSRDRRVGLTRVHEH
ncbi:hypothetical protein PHBOTO_002801 [Pseudozyma hubeiensis]|nr:hypothetical protein PHBOTO_002801 [Pseudozyma hubeiensis]